MFGSSGSFIETCESIAASARDAAALGIDPVDQAFWLGLSQDWLQLATAAAQGGIFHLATVASA